MSAAFRRLPCPKFPVVFLLFAFAAFLPATAGRNPTKVNITASIEFIEDPHATLSFAEISRPSEVRWQKIGADATRFSFSPSVYWLRLDLAHYPDFTGLRNLYIVFEWKALDSLELFPAPVKRIVAGDAFPKAEWSLPEAHFPAFRIDPGESEQKIYFVRLESSSIKNFPVFLKSETTYLGELKHEIMIIFAYSTLILVLVAFATFLFLVSRDVTYLLYVGYILSISLAFDVTYGNTFDLFWPDATWWQNRAGFTFIGAQVVFSLLFVSRLLDFPRILPNADRACKILAVLCLGTLPFTLTTLPVAVFSRIYSLIYLISIPGFFAIGIYLLPRSQSHVRLFIAGWGLVFFFGIFHILYIMNILPFHNFYVYSPIFALPVDIFFFFMSIWEKQRSLDREKLRLLDEKIDALEGRPKYQKSSLSEVDVQRVLANLDILINREKIYLIEDLRLPDLAKALHLNRTQLSELLNSRFKLTFPQFINSLRIEEAKQMLRAEKEKNILEVAFATGFGSKAAFSLEFKRQTGLTAKEYRQQG